MLPPSSANKHHPSLTTKRAAGPQRPCRSSMIRRALLSLHLEHAAHDHVVAGEGADVRVVAGLFGGGELDHLVLAVIKELAGPDDVGAFRDPLLVEALGTEREDLRGDIVGLARMHEQDVVLPEVRIREGELDPLAGLHGDFLHIVAHALRHGGDAKAD